MSDDHPEDGSRETFMVAGIDTEEPADRARFGEVYRWVERRKLRRERQQQRLGALAWSLLLTILGGLTWPAVRACWNWLARYWTNGA